MKHFSFLLFVTILCFSFLNAQVKTNYNSSIEINERGQFNKSYRNQYHEIAAPDTSEIIKKEKADKDSREVKPFRFAEPISVSINVVEQADWTNDTEFAYGRFNFRIPKAKSVSINFNRFYLPSGTELFIYNKNGKMITGPITSTENNKNDVWGSSVYKGNELTIEFKVPINLKKEIKLNLSNIAYGYKKIFSEKIYGFGSSGTCNINVLCPQGATWGNERNSVGLILNQNGSVWCSGSMLNNTCSTNIPYLLTANYCLNNGNENVANWRYIFQYMSPQCSPNQDGSNSLLFNGSTLRANWAPSDFALVQLNQTPASNSGINYAGWTRSTTAATSGVGIHHPSGDVMKISTYTTPVVRADNAIIGGIDPVGDLQWIVQWNQGVTEGGSSGSPLFDQNHRIIGQLGGGPSACGAAVLQDAYGRFDNSWTGGGTNATRLSNWLDHNNTGAITTNTTNISALSNPTPALSISGNATLCATTGSYTLNGAPAGATISWVSSNPGIATVTSSGNPATVTKIANGNVTITANAGATNCTSVNSTSFAIRSGTYSGGGDFTIDGPSTACPNSYVGYQTTALPGATNYTWILPNGWTIVAGQGTPNLSATTSGTVNGTVRLKVSNACGTGAPELMYVSLEAWCSGQFLLSPNPATNTVTIQQKDKTEKAPGQPDAIITEIRIFDNIGNLKKQIKYGAGTIQAQVNVADLKTGIYFVEISGEQTKERKQLIIQK